MAEEYFVRCDEAYNLFLKHDNIYRAWLNEIIGRSGWQFYGAGSTHPGTIRFETREDALAFKLKFNITEGKYSQLD